MSALRSPLAAALLLAALGPAAAVAAPPGNDARSAPGKVSLPSSVAGTTAEATLEPDEPYVACGSMRSSVWYEVTAPAAERLAIRLDAGGDLDAIVDVFQRRRSQLTPVACEQTDADGEGAISFRATRGATYLIRVGARFGSAAGPFRLDVFLPRPEARGPGALLPARGARGTVDPLQNTSDAFSVRMAAGRSYRINLFPSAVRLPGSDDDPTEGCVRLRIYPPGTRDFDDARPLRTLRCGGYVLWTPRAGEGGRHPILVEPGLRRGSQPYRLKAAAAGPDDTAPGEYLSNRERARGALSARGLDVVDLYRFDVVRRSDLQVDLDTGEEFSATLLSDRGRRIETLDGADSLRRTVAPGRYFLAVRATAGAAGRYTLTRVSRTITRASMTWGGRRSRQVAPGTTSRAVLTVAPRVSGPALLTIERFDPLAGWIFHRALRTQVRAGRAVVAFTPPAEGRYRVRGEYRGTATAAPSDTSWASLLVAPPLRP